jgi:hypothetical protein
MKKDAEAFSKVEDTSKPSQDHHAHDHGSRLQYGHLVIARVNYLLLWDFTIYLETYSYIMEMN